MPDVLEFSLMKILSIFLLAKNPNVYEKKNTINSGICSFLYS